MIERRKKILAFVFFQLMFLYAGAQSTAIYESPEVEYRSAIDLYAKEKFGAAQDHFDYVISAIDNPFSPLRINAEYYSAVCAIELYNKDGAYRLDQFAKKHPTNSRINLVNFQLGKLSHQERKYKQAIEYFELVDDSELSANEKHEYYFKFGYSYFKRDDFDNAEALFQKVASASSKYRSPAEYYLAHLSYVKGDYDLALQRFEALNDDPNFKSVAPYYVVQILFLQEKYTEVIQMAPGLMENATEKRKAELMKVLGESFFLTGDYIKALPYLEEYHGGNHRAMDRNDNYSLGFCYYVAENYDKAETYLQKVTATEDALAQYAYYYLGVCYLENGQKQFAANAFNSASKKPFDREIREDALFKQAQLAFEMSSDPYSEAVNALKAYLVAYPDSKRSDEAYNFLFNISVSTRNFLDARDALEHIQVKGADYKKNYQKLSYYQGIDLFNQLNYEEAIDAFKRAIEYNTDKQIELESLFWMAESFYRQENYWGAKKYYLEFLAAPKATKLSLYNMANYNLGYAYFKKDEYNGAIFYFKDFIKNVSNEKPVLVADAYLRLGDSWFINKNYDNAIEFYNNAIKLNAVDVDYAMLKKSRALGVLQRYPEQIQNLKMLAKTYPNSASIGEVYYELADAYLLTNDKENALLNFKKVASDFPNSSFAVKSRLKSGLIYYNSGMNDLAINTFKGVVTDFPATPESKEALGSLRNIYVELGKVDEFLAYTDGLAFASVSASEQDSLMYASAENLYMDENYTAALPAFGNYVQKFPEGAFQLNARFFLAECQVKEGLVPEALLNYEYVIEKPRSEFTESSLLKAADLTYELSNYSTSLIYFTQLEKTAEVKSNIMEAWYGQMKCNYELDKFAEAVPVATKLLEAEKISDEMKLEAMIIKANSLLKSGDVLLAKSQYKEIKAFSQGEAGAEAQFNIALIEFTMSDLDKAEAEVFELVNNFSAYDYWVARGFILLADIYVKKDNLFQAQQTLQSIIENYDGPELRDVAIQKLKAITPAEAPASEDLNEKPDSIKVEDEMIELEEF